MPTFSIAPVGPFPPATDEGFPQFIQFQGDGVNLGGPDADTVNFTDGISATRGVGENANVVTATAVPILPTLTWRVIAGDGMVEAADVDNGIAMTATSGSALLTVPTGVIPSGHSVLVLQEGDAPVILMMSSGGDFIYRTAVFDPETAGPGAILTLIGRDDARVVLCGDLATA
jgi:hypothetical protein